MAQAAAIAAGATPADVADAAAAAAPTAAAATAGDGVQQQLKRSECSVYLASDEPNVATEERQKYKHYNFSLHEH
jgi:hypothetical protein